MFVEQTKGLNNAIRGALLVIIRHHKLDDVQLMICQGVPPFSSPKVINMDKHINS